MKKLLLLTLLATINSVASFAQYTDLIDFTGTSGPYPGGIPQGSLTLSVTGDTLFGMTLNGGANGDGTIFSVHTDGTGYTDLIDFTWPSGPYPGDFPWGDLTLSGGVLYGMTSSGGAGGGTIFSVHTDGTGYTDLIDFTLTSGPYPGGIPQGSLTLSVTGDTLFGMTQFGGANNYGTIFSVHTDGTGYTDLIDFTGTSGSYPGSYPYGSLTLSGGVLYGMTSAGGETGDGNIFSVHTDGTNYTDLIDFTGTSGSYIGDAPRGSLTLSGGVLYGMTDLGGANEVGTIFSVHTDGTGYTDLIDFTGGSGSYSGELPYFGSLTLSGGVLYGMTSVGGANEVGTIFSVHTDGTGYTDLIGFTGASGSYPGDAPRGSLTLSEGVLYGMTSVGGAGYGNIFSYKDTSNTTGVNKIAASADVKLYPNPNNGVFTIQSPQISNPSLVDIYNMIGEKVFTSTLSSGRGGNTININSQPDGIYLYRISGEDGGLISEGKIVIEH